MFCWKTNPKQHLKFVLYTNKVCGFLHTNLELLLFTKTLCFIFSSVSCSLEIYPFELSQVTSSWSKQQEFKIKTNKVPWSVLILTTLFIQNHILILPINNFHFLIPNLLCNLLGTSKMKVLLSSKEKFQNSRIMHVFSCEKYWQ